MKCETDMRKLGRGEEKEVKRKIKDHKKMRNDNRYIHPGWVNGFQEVEWRNDPLVNCHNMDALWGFMI